MKHSIVWLAITLLVSCESVSTDQSDKTVAHLPIEKSKTGQPYSQHIETFISPKNDDDRFEVRSQSTFYFETRGSSFGPIGNRIEACPTNDDLTSCTFDRHIISVFRVVPGEYSVSPHEINQDGGFDQPLLRTLVTAEGPSHAPVDLAEVGVGTPWPAGSMKITIGAKFDKLVIRSRYSDRPFKRWGEVVEATISPIEKQP